MRVGIDFGLSVTDIVVLDDGEVVREASLVRPGPADAAQVRRALAAVHLPADRQLQVAVTGGRSRELPAQLDGASLTFVEEPAAIGRGGLHVSGCDRALVVSCGTGTAMVRADAAEESYRHVTGTPVGGGTLEGLAWRLLGLREAREVSDLAQRGSAAGVDTTLAEVLGGGVGALPPTATAVSLGRLSTMAAAPDPADLAAGLVTMVAQTIALLALNAARAQELRAVVFIGRVCELPPVRSMIEAVFRVYGEPPPHLVGSASTATALGAALSLP